jgi:hypothetical protein
MRMVRLDQRYQKTPTIVSREIAGEVILVPIRNNLGDLGSIYTLNETGALAWSLLDAEHSLRQICEQIVMEYEVTPEQAERDLKELVEQLCEIEAVTAV